MILMIDNYDSFTFNLVQALQAAGADVRVIRNDQVTRAEVEAMADDPAQDLRGHRHLARARRPGLRRRERRHHRGRPRARHPAARRLPRHAVDGDRLGRLDRPGADARPRRGQRRPPRRRGPPRRDAPGLPGRALPLPVRRPRHAPRGPLRDRHQPRGRRRHGPPPPHAADRGRPVPPGVRPHARRARTCSRTSSGSPGRATARGSTPSTGSFATRGMAEAADASWPRHAPGAPGPPDERPRPGRGRGDRRRPARCPWTTRAWRWAR